MSSLIKEETDETRHAMARLFRASAWPEGGRREALAEVADGLADLIYVAVGAALELGIPLAAVWDEVHTANMRKTTGEKRADGKQMKPAGWVGPDVMGAVFGKR
jgi:predicted HAD superfamily Cof-like phosphohydrolase